MVVIVIVVSPISNVRVRVKYTIVLKKEFYYVQCCGVHSCVCVIMRCDQPMELDTILEICVGTKPNLYACTPTKQINMLVIEL